MAIWTQKAVLVRLPVIYTGHHARAKYQVLSAKLTLLKDLSILSP